MYCGFSFLFLFCPIPIGTTVEREIDSGTETTTTLATITLPPGVEVRYKKNETNKIYPDISDSRRLWKLSALKSVSL